MTDEAVQTKNVRKNPRKIAVVLFNLGGPDQPDSVRPFLFNLFNDKNIITIPQPFRILLAWLISKKRAPEAQEIYEHLGEKSPLLEYTEDQAKALEDRLNVADPSKDHKVFIAMRYWHPMTAATVGAVQDWGPDQVALLPLYPQFSTSTTRSSAEEWAKTTTAFGLNVPTRTSCCYPTQSDFIAAHADVTLKALAELQKETDRPVRILFSAHGVPQKFIDNGDPYRAQIEATVEAVAAKMKEMQPEAQYEHMVTFQSRVGPLKWTEPYTDHEIERAGSENVALLVTPIAFVSDHSETLVELGIEYRELAEEHGVPAYHVVPALGTHEDYVTAMASEVQRLSVSGPAVSSHTGQRFCADTWAQCPCRMEIVTVSTP